MLEKILRVRSIHPVYDRDAEDNFIGFDVTYEMDDEATEKGLGKHGANVIKGDAKIRTEDRRVSKEMI